MYTQISGNLSKAMQKFSSSSIPNSSKLHDIFVFNRILNVSTCNLARFPYDEERVPQLLCADQKLEDFEVDDDVPFTTQMFGPVGNTPTTTFHPIGSPPNQYLIYGSTRSNYPTGEIF